MKVYGYKVGDDESLMSMREVSFLATGSEARALARFLDRCADGMEAMDEWDHEHFAGGEVPDVVVCSAEKYEE